MALYLMCRKNWPTIKRECQPPIGGAITKRADRTIGTGCQQPSELVDTEPWRSRGILLDDWVFQLYESVAATDPLHLIAMVARPLTETSISPGSLMVRRRRA